MKNYIVYRPDTGEILRTGCCPDEAFYLQAGEGEAVRAGEAQDDQHTINHLLGTIDKKPPPPPPPSPTLEELKEAKKKEIKAAFNAAFFHGYTTQGLASNFKVDCRRDDKDNLKSLADMMEKQGIATTKIRTFDNAFVEGVTVSDLNTIVDELVAYGFTLYGRKWEREEEIAAAQTAEEVESITW